MRIRMTRGLPWKVRILVSLLISMMPSNLLRIWLHRMVNGYRISGHARIGFAAILAVDEAKIGRSTIRWFNRFEGPFDLVIEDGTIIGPSNRFASLFDPAKNEDGTSPSYCKIGRNVSIGEKNLIDATGGFQIGDNSWIAGYESQFWTHGPRNGPIAIGNDCFICSAVRFAPGSSIGNHVIVAMGSVVTKNFVDNIMIGGVPARIMSK